MILPIIILLCAALFMPVQTSLNSRLSLGVKSPLIAALISFLVGSAALYLTLLASGNMFHLTPSLFTSLPWWAWLGGCAGVAGILVNILLFPRLGSVQTVLLVMFGQVSAGILVDQFGLFEATPRPFTWLRILGLAIAILGICLVVINPNHKSERSRRNLLPYQVLGLLGGFAFGIQPSLNNRLAMALDSSLQASTISFTTGSLLLIVLILLLTSQRKCLVNLSHSHTPWWCWLGGLIGVASVWCSAAFVEKVGVGLLTIITIFGMLLSSTLIDCYGLFGSTKRPIAFRHVGGLILVFFGMLLL